MIKRLAFVVTMASLVIASLVGCTGGTVYLYVDPTMIGEYEYVSDAIRKKGWKIEPLSTTNTVTLDGNTILHADNRSARRNANRLRRELLDIGLAIYSVKTAHQNHSYTKSNVGLYLADIAVRRTSSGARSERKLGERVLHSFMCNESLILHVETDGVAFISDGAGTPVTERLRWSDQSGVFTLHDGSKKLATYQVTFLDITSEQVRNNLLMISRSINTGIFSCNFRT